MSSRAKEVGGRPSYKPSHSNQSKIKKEGKNNLKSENGKGVKKPKKEKKLVDTGEGIPSLYLDSLLNNPLTSGDNSNSLDFLESALVPLQDI